jgi:hypothetical protein
VDSGIPPEYDQQLGTQMPVRSRRFSFGFRSVFLVFVAGISAWCQQAKHASESRPSFFVVTHGATEVKQSRWQGHDQIVYRIRASYPADNLLNTITVRLGQLGWRPLKEDWLNPGLPSSHVRGWTYYEDETTKPSTSVRAWGAQWENGAHDILEYMLEYRCPGDLGSSTYDLHDLQVIAIHIPADLAKRTKASTLIDRTDPRKKEATSPDNK